MPRSVEVPRNSYRVSRAVRRERRVDRGGTGFANDWVDFAACLMLLAGALDFFQGLIAIVRDKYYTVTPNQVIVFDLTTWGWILLFWGTAVALAGFGLWLRSSVARWCAIAVTGINVIWELSFAGGNNFPLWGLVVIALNVVVLYALILRWHGAERTDV